MAIPIKYSATPIDNTFKVGNIVFGNGNADYGPTTVNLLYDNGVKNWLISPLTVTTTVTTIIANSKYRITLGNYLGGYTFADIRMTVPLSKLTDGSGYTLSFKYEIISGNTFQINDWCDTPVTPIVIDYGSYKFTAATGTRSTYSDTYRFMDFHTEAYTIVDIWDIQLEERAYYTPFTVFPGFYAGIDPPDSGYTLYFPGGPTGINAKVVNNDTELLLVAKEHGGSSIQTITDAINYLATGSTGTTIINANISPIVTNGLVLYTDAGFLPSYPKSGTEWRDISGNGNNTTLVNGPIWNSSAGGKIMLDGANQYIQVTAANVDLNGFEHQIHWDLNWTIECWIYTHTFDASPQTYKHIYGSYNGCNYSVYPAAAGGLILFNTTTSPYAYMDFAPQSPSGCGPAISWSTGESTWITALQNRWTHFVFTSEDATYYRIYVNGVQVGSTKTFDWKNNATRINTCNRAAGNKYAFGGDGSTTSNEVDFSQCRIYNRTLSATEILQNYNADISRFYGAELIVNGDFDETTGWTLTSGVVISGGTMTFSPPASAFVYNTNGGTLSIGKTYRIIYNVVQVLGGTGYIKSACGGWGIGSEFTTAGRKEEIITIVNASGVFSFYGGLSVILDDVSVKEVL